MLADEFRGRRAALSGLFLFLLCRGVGSLGSGLLGSLQGLQFGQFLGGVDAGEDVLALVQGGVDGQRAEGGGTVRTVEPVKLIFKSKDWYLYGFCLLRNDYRFFKLTRIKDLTLLPETFLRRKADVPELKPTIQQERLISVRLKFSPAAAFRVYDEFTDTVEKDAQGSLYVTVDMPERTLYSYILSYGDTVEILEPDELRRSMKEKLTRMAEKYKT